MIRSAGSRGGSPGKKDEAINISGDRSASTIPSVLRRRLNHDWGGTGNLMRPREQSNPISHAEIGDTNTGAVAANARFMAFTASSAIGNSPANHMAAQVSSNSGASTVIFDRPNYDRRKLPRPIRDQPARRGRSPARSRLCPSMHQ